jgi:hypothetical protein
MPGYKCPIKERMLYSACKNTFISQLEETLKLEIEKKVCIYVIPISIATRFILLTDCLSSWIQGIIKWRMAVNAFIVHVAQSGNKECCMRGSYPASIQNNCGSTQVLTRA